VLGTILLVGMIVCGYFNLTPWLLIPAAVIAAFIGVHFPPGKAEMAKQRGIYWKIIFSSLPLHGILVSVLFGIGWGFSVII
jgi:hypothetical protein